MNSKRCTGKFVSTLYWSIVTSFVFSRYHLLSRGSFPYSTRTVNALHSICSLFNLQFGLFSHFLRVLSGSFEVWNLAE